MRFTILGHYNQIPLTGRSQGYLVLTAWDDWFKFQTQYFFAYTDSAGRRHDVGNVKIGMLGMREEIRTPDVPLSFTKLDKIFFSVGQDVSYYEELNTLPEDEKFEIFDALRDFAYDVRIYDSVRTEPVTYTSLMRYLPETTLRQQFYRMAHGGARLSMYDVTYMLPTVKGYTGINTPKVSMQLKVDYASYPPSNIHVLIGRNGVGKTTLLAQMSRALANPDGSDPGVDGYFREGQQDNPRNLFANVVYVSFSAFDDFNVMNGTVTAVGPERGDSGVSYSYVGLRRVAGHWSESDQYLLKRPSDLAIEFGNSVRVCMEGARSTRWQDALRSLEGDPIFADAEVSKLAESKELERDAQNLFNRFSSGHKIVLLTVTRLVEVVEERSLVLLDEPESHLHPPLLAAFVRTLSNLLINRNGVAVIATHSPVVLQEVPSNCVWKVNRSGLLRSIERPTIETFGENVGVLTREIFGLEVTRSGFHELLEEAVRAGKSYEEVLEQFDERLGGEARSLVQVLIAMRTRGES